MRARTRRSPSRYPSRRTTRLAAVGLAIGVVSSVATTVSADVELDGALVEPYGGQVAETAAAYNPDDDEYLVLYSDAGDRLDRRYVRLLDGDGTVKAGSPEREIAEPFAFGRLKRGAVEYDRTNQQYLVSTIGPSGVITRVVERDGTLGPGATLFPANRAHDMAHDPVNGRYLVVGAETPSAGASLHRAQVVDADGQPISPVRVFGAESAVYNPYGPADDTAVSFDPRSETYLVAFTWGPRTSDVDPMRVHVQRIDADGVLIGSPVPVTETVTSRRIRDLALASDPTTGRHLLMYSRYDGNEQRWSQLLAADGTTIGEPHLVTTRGDLAAAHHAWDASTGGWVGHGSRNWLVQLDPSGRPICGLVDDGSIVAHQIVAGPSGEFLVVGRDYRSNTNGALGVQPIKVSDPDSTVFVGATSPSRLFDSRPGEAPPGPKGKVGPLGSVKIQVRGVGGIPASTDVTAVVANVTVISSERSYASAYASGDVAPGDLPTTSTLNSTAAGQVRANTAIIPVGPDGKVEVFARAASDVILDVTGWFERVPCEATGGRFEPLPVTRVFDSRPGQPAPGPKGHLDAGEKVTVQIAGRGGVPTTGVEAVALAVVATNSDGRGYVTVAPTISGRPTTSLINLNAAGETAPNAVITPLSANGTVDVYVRSGADIAIDVSGYFTDGSAPRSSAGLYIPITPGRIFDSRPATDDPGPKGVVDDREITVDATGVAGVPSAGVAAVALNVAALSRDLPGYVTAWSGATDRPTTSVLNFAPFDVRAAFAITPLSPAGNLDLFIRNAAEPFADVSGFFTAPDYYFDSP